MEADYSIELGKDDPVLDFPWTDPSGKLRYFDLKRHPELMEKIEEVREFPELAEFLRVINSGRSAFESAKCDAWVTTELSDEENIFNASHKCASYVDLVASSLEARGTYKLHRQFAGKWKELMRRVPEISASAELCLRRCFSVGPAETTDGFYFTLYVNGYGEDEFVARKNWNIGLGLTGNAIVQLSAGF
jgi:hypothetical protein